MKAAKVFLEMLKEYEVDCVFGLPGETTLPIYVEWLNYPDIKHIMARDERSAAYMADGYARVSFKPGIVEAPSAGAAHILPAIVEAYKASIPLIAITTDVPLHMEKKNMLTGFNQSSLFSGVTKETHTITKSEEIPYIIRRAFRIATTGKPGPVHIRIPMDILEQDVNLRDIYAQKDFVRYPGHRFTAEAEKVMEATDLLLQSGKPLIICGQGVLLSQAWDEVIKLAELLRIPIGTTITGKGVINSDHPLSIGVIGSRGGTSFSNKIVDEADTIFYIGCNTDSAATDNWTLPSPYNGKNIIHLDVSEVEAGNVYKTCVIMIGDAKATLKLMIKLAKEKTYDNTARSLWVKTISELREKYNTELKEKLQKIKSLHPLKILKALENYIPEKHIIVADAGVSAIYTSAFWPVRKPGRSLIFNYSMGSLGYSLPASVGAYMAKPDHTIVTLMGDGSFGFVAGEFETVRRINANIKIFLYNNRSFGWIRATLHFKYKAKYFSTDFCEVDYCKIAEGYRIPAYSVNSLHDLNEIFKRVFREEGPAFIELKVEPEDKEVPPVPKWVKACADKEVEMFY